MLDKKKIATGKTKHGLAAKFLTENGKAVNYDIFEQFMNAGFADLRPASGTTPPWQLPPTAKPRSLPPTGETSGEWPRQSVPTSLHDDAMHAAPMRLDYALANSAAQRRMGSSPENWHAGPVQTLFTDTLSDHFPLQVLLCEHDIPAGSCAPKIRARLEARESLEARLGCDNDGWNKWRQRQVMTKQTAAREAVETRIVAAVQARPSSLAAATRTASAALVDGQLEERAGAGLVIDAKDRRIETLIDWTDPLLWRAAPQSSSSGSKFASATSDLELEYSWKVVRVRGRAGASCSQVCLDEGRRRRETDPLQQQSAQSALKATPTAATTSAAAAGQGLGPSRTVPAGFELTPGEGGLRNRRRLAQHDQRSMSLFGHEINFTKLEELEQRKQVKRDQVPTVDFAAEAAVAGALELEQEGDGEGTGQLGIGHSEPEDCLVHETNGVCANGGACVHIFGSAACVCEEGFSGHHCEDVTDRSQGPRSQAHVAGEDVSVGDQRLTDAISRVKAKDEAGDRVLEAEVLAGARGSRAKLLLEEVLDKSAGSMTRERMAAVLRKGAEAELDVDVLLLARTLSMKQLPLDVQQAIDGGPAQLVRPKQDGDAGIFHRQRPARAPPPVTEWDWQCSSKQIEASSDCEQMTAEFGCANGCR